MNQPPNPLLSILINHWNSLKAKFHNWFTLVETYFKIILFFIIFTSMVINGLQYVQVQTVTKDKIRFKDSVRIVDQVRDLHIKAINKRIKEMEELSIASQQENIRLQQELNQLQGSKKNAMKEIDGYSNEDLANWFKGRAIKPKKP